MESMATTKKAPARKAKGAAQVEVPQQDFLRDAMTRLGYTRKQLADRIGVSQYTVENWLQPTPEEGSQVNGKRSLFRVLKPMPRKYISDILHWEGK